MLLFFFNRKEGLDLRKEQFAIKSMCKAFESKIEVSEGLKTTLKLKEVLVTAKVSVVSLKSMPL
jgi:hypothetical protein